MSGVEVEQDDFARIVAETSARARGILDEFDHPLETERRIAGLLEELRNNSHTFSIEPHPEQTPRNRAGQLARRLALNPGEQRRLNRDLLKVIEQLDQRTRRQEAEIARLRIEVDRLLALRSHDPER